MTKIKYACNNSKKNETTSNHKINWAWSKRQLIINKQISKESGENKQLKTIFEARKFKKIEINF